MERPKDLSLGCTAQYCLGGWVDECVCVCFGTNLIVKAFSKLFLLFTKVEPLSAWCWDVDLLIVE